MRTTYGITLFLIPNADKGSASRMPFADDRTEAYYNTTDEVGDQLKQHRRKAVEQDTAVLEFYSCLAAASPSQCHEMLIKAGVISGATPLTSIRRSITSLTTRGLLVKTDQRVIGAYGRPEFCWRQALDKPQQLQLIIGGKS